jgi:hypothetical protein
MQIDSRSVAQGTSTGGLAEFAKAVGLEPGTGGPLPDEGGLLGRGDLRIEASAHGKLPGDHDGVIAHTVYTTRSDDTTTTHRNTAVVVRVPESMGYAPYLQLGLTNGIQSGAKSFEPVPGTTVIADEGIDRGWLTELLSPAFCEWLSRSPQDFGAELRTGVLTVSRGDHISEEGKLRSLCEDAAKIADRLREEAVEEVESGGGAVAKAKPASRDERLAAALIPEMGVTEPPAHVESEIAAGRHAAAGSGAVIWSVIKTWLLIQIAVNVIGGGIYGLLLNLPNVKLAVLIYQGLLFVIILPLVYRSRTSNVAKKASEEAFWIGYAQSHGLKEIAPLQFSAEYAEAGLPAQPIRVYEGLFGGTLGHLMLTGNGRTRGDQIALVRGPKGPTAVADLNVSAPGISTKALDESVKTLLLDLETQPRAAPA